MKGVRGMKNKILAIIFIIILASAIIQVNHIYATSANVKGQVTILPVADICKTYISHFDHTIIGTKDYQRLIGTNQNDLIIGFKNTWIDGENGDDCLKGGNGKNVIKGENGNDVILGGTGDNLIFTGKGNNIVKGGPANDIIFFGNGHNTIDGGPGKNYCVGNPKNSIITNCIVISHHEDRHFTHDSREILEDILGHVDVDRHIPSWTKKNLDWWENGKISDDDLASGMKYLLGRE